jgi:hypothetical protein
MVTYLEILCSGDDEVPVIYGYRQLVALDEFSYICP